ncbi:MAG: class I SAM-dependent methyltransferase [Deltaproteobacteria bacterium]|nr:class I SAM-dependent methyltransferase [Deltaproteobacteria bacterium]
MLATAMALPDEYERQQRWRRYGDALKQVPLVRGQRVLDLGCGVGAASALFAAAGADVIGVDVDDALLLRARELHAELRFEKHDVGALDASTFGRVDGIWASFVAAYFSDLPSFVARLRELLVDGGWVALVEIDDLLGHEPRSAAFAADIAGFYAWARAQGGYGFLHGRALAPALRDAGFELVHEGTLEDGELSFRGPASADVVEAWRSRFTRMGGMRTYYGDRFGEVSGEILAALQAPSHRSLCRVDIVVARR